MGFSCEKIDQMLECQIIDRCVRYNFNLLIDTIINGFPNLSSELGYISLNKYVLDFGCDPVHGGLLWILVAHAQGCSTGSDYSYNS